MVNGQNEWSDQGVSHYDRRVSTLAAKDPLHMIHLKKYFIEILARVQQAVGGPGRFQKLCEEHCEMRIVQQIHGLVS